MSRSLAIRRLWWKEFQQLWPLVGLLLLLGLILHVLALLLPGLQSWRHSAALLAMPGLFAAGAGALLVGQEKELRTLDWLRSLPIAAADLVRTKLLVGLLGLAVVWLASVLLGAATGSLDAMQLGTNNAYLYPLHSLFLLLIGFATAWYFRSSLISLLVVVPLACLPLVASTLLQWWVNADRSLRFVDPQPSIVATNLVLFSVVALWLGRKTALSYLAPAKPPRNWRESSALTPAASRVGNFPRTSPGPALLWQFAAQNRAALGGIGLLLLASLASVLAGLSINGQAIGVFFLAGLFAVSWLGVLVFQSDVQQQRIMFLADRGVSPRIIWLTRQAIPFASLTLFLLLFMLVSTAFSDQIDDQIGVGLGTAGIAIVSTCALGVYLVAQWLGQVVRSPVLAAIVTPFAAAGAIAYGVFAFAELGASPWLLGLSLVFPLVATFSLMRRWMDHRLGWSYWFCHGAMLLVALVLPISNFLVYTATYPTLSAQAKADLQAIASQYPAYSFAQTLPSPATVSQPDENEVQVPAVPQAEQRDAYFASLRRILAENARGVPETRVVYNCISDAILLRLGENRAVDGSELNVQALQRYRESIGLLLQCQARFRADGQLSSQDHADVCEMLLLAELKAGSPQQRLGDALYQQVVDVLSDRQARREARRRAIALCWSAVENNRNVNFGGYSLTPNHGGRITTKDVWDTSRKAGLISELLLKTVDASDADLVRLRSEICRMMGFPASYAAADVAYLAGPDGEPQLLYSELRNHQFPGRYWNGAWEREAAEFEGQ